jgi:hypothetical protein
LGKTAWKLPIQQTQHFLLQSTCEDTWTTFCHPEHGSKISFWNTGTQLYYVVYKPKEMTIIWTIGRTCEKLMWKVKFTIDISCLTSKYLIQMTYLTHSTSCQ